MVTPSRRGGVLYRPAPQRGLIAATPFGSGPRTSHTRDPVPAPRSTAQQAPCPGDDVTEPQQQQPSAEERPGGQASVVAPGRPPMPQTRPPDEVADPALARGRRLKEPVA